MATSIASSAANQHNVGTMDEYDAMPDWPMDVKIDRPPPMLGQEPIQRTATNSSTQSQQEAVGNLLHALAQGSNALGIPVAPAQREPLQPEEGTPGVSTVNTNFQHGADANLEATIVNNDKNTAGALEVQADKQHPLLESDKSNNHLSMQDAALPEFTFPTPDFGPESDPSFLRQNMPVPDLSIPFAAMPTQPLTLATSPQALEPLAVKRQIDAFARLDFPDGTFYLNTYQCELGRDQYAYKDAQRREAEEKEAQRIEQERPRLPSRSQRSVILSLRQESNYQGSVVSEAGGFAGVDEQPVERYGKLDALHNSLSSGHSESSGVVKPSEVLHNPSLALFDYNKQAFASAQDAIDADNAYDNEKPAPVTADHLPDASSCPLIPIHATVANDQTEVENLKGISRRHVKIYWSYGQEAFVMDVLGRNGAFVGKKFCKRGSTVRLYHGAAVQISAVSFIFKLPNVKIEDEMDGNEMLGSDEELEEPLSNDAEEQYQMGLRLGGEYGLVNGEGRRRGPGRPPKNGVMSQREMKEREKADKEAKAKGFTGLPVTSPTLERKPPKAQLSKPELMNGVKKSAKRKREEGEDDTILPSIEEQEAAPVIQQPIVPPPAPKRARTKSLSPIYKPKEECTAEELARPPHNYAVLLYMVLSETGEITLRQIYRQMQLRWPYFKHVVDSDGWTSSVRHNLNQEVGKLFQRGRKEGKGFTWLPIKDAMAEYQAQKNKRSNAPQVPRPKAQTQQQRYNAPQAGQQHTWQNTAAAPLNAQPGSFPAHNWPQQNRPLPPPMPPKFLLPGLENQPYDFNHPAPSHLPVTFNGLAVIIAFERTMMTSLGLNDETKKKWNQIFRSAKARCLHGAECSLLPDGETHEEKTILHHIRNFVATHPNPTFKEYRPDLPPPRSPVMPPAQTQSVNAPPQNVQRAGSLQQNQQSFTPQVQSSTPTPLSRPAGSEGQAAPLQGTQVNGIGQPLSTSSTIQTHLRTTTGAQNTSDHAYPKPAPGIAQNDDRADGNIAGPSEKIGPNTHQTSVATPQQSTGPIKSAPAQQPQVQTLATIDTAVDSHSPSRSPARPNVSIVTTPASIPSPRQPVINNSASTDMPLQKQVDAEGGSNPGVESAGSTSSATVIPNGHGSAPQTPGSA